MALPKIENKLAAINKEHDEKYAAELEVVKTDIDALLTTINDIMEGVKEKDKPKLLKGAKFEQLVALSGIMPDDEEPRAPRRGRRKARSSRAELTDEAVKEYIGKGSKTKTELCAYFSGGNKKVVKFLDDMVKAKKLETEMTKSKKNKDVTNYSVK